jgi:hypothetical protein
MDDPAATVDSGAAAPLPADSLGDASAAAPPDASAPPPAMGESAPPAVRVAVPPLHHHRRSEDYEQWPIYVAMLVVCVIVAVAFYALVWKPDHNPPIRTVHWTPPPMGQPSDPHSPYGSSNHLDIAGAGGSDHQWTHHGIGSPEESMLAETILRAMMDGGKADNHHGGEVVAHAPSPVQDSHSGGGGFGGVDEHATPVHAGFMGPTTHPKPSFWSGMQVLKPGPSIWTDTPLGAHHGGVLNQYPVMAHPYSARTVVPVVHHTGTGAPIVVHYSVPVHGPSSVVRH